MKKFGVIALAAVLSAAIPLSRASVSAAGEETVWDDEIDFGSEEEVRSKFTAHFCSDQGTRRADDLSYSWKLDGGVLTRTNNVDPKLDTRNIAVLTYTGNTYDDFEMSVDYRMGGKNKYWPVVGIRQQIPGKYYTTEGGGAGIFMQDSGKITMWGPILGGLQEYPIPNVGSYDNTEWHTMRIRAEGRSVVVWIDGTEVREFSVNSTDYIKGYISLQSVNNDCSFDNFKIRAIGTDEAVQNEPNKSPFAGDGIPLEDYIRER